METYAPRSLSAALLEHGRVIHALMLRDIKTRFGASYLGFIAGLIMPLAHIGVIMAIYIALGRRAPIGTGASVYLSSAIVPFVIWSYTHQKVMHCFSQNRSLTAFPIVKFIDILIARYLVELLNSVIIVCVVAVSFNLLIDDLIVLDPKSIILMLVIAYLLGISTGLIFGIISLLIPSFMLIGFILIPLYWLTSGIFFIPEALPEPVKAVVSIFPLSHLVDFGRTALFPSYMSEYPNLLYVIFLIIMNFVIGLTLELVLRPALTSR